MAIPASVQKELHGALANVGLSSSETVVLLALLQSSKGIRATELAKKTKLNRTTLYGVAKSLIEKGLASSVEERGVLRYHSIQPDLLVNYIEQAKERLVQDAERIKKALPILNAQRSGEGRSYPTVQFFEGVEGIKQAYEDTIQNNKHKVMYGFLGTDAVLRLMDPAWLIYYITKRVHLGVKAFTIAIDTPSSRHYKGYDGKQLRTTKLLPPGYDFEIEVVAYDDKVLITSFSEDHPLSVLIEDEKIAQLMVALFRYMDSTLLA